MKLICIQVLLAVWLPVAVFAVRSGPETGNVNLMHIPGSGLINRIPFAGRIGGMIGGSLEVGNDGPGTLDLPITFYAELHAGASGWAGIEEFVYRFEDAAHQYVREGVGNTKIRLRAVLSSEKVRPGTYNMTVTVFARVKGIKAWTIASGNTSYTVSDQLLGNMTVKQETFPWRIQDLDTISVGDLAHFTATLRDAQQLEAQNWTMSYIWTVGNSPTPSQVSPSPDFFHNFTTLGNTSVTCVINALRPAAGAKQAVSRYATLTRQIRVLDHVSELRVIGDTYLARKTLQEHGGKLTLGLECDGEGPFEMCSFVEEASDQRTAAAAAEIADKAENFICDKHEYSFTECRFEYMLPKVVSNASFIVFQYGNQVSWSRRKVALTLY